MITKKFARDLLRKYGKTLDEVQLVINQREQFSPEEKMTIPKIKEALQTIADPLINDSSLSQDIFKDEIRLHGFRTFCYAVHDYSLNEKMNEFYEVAREMLEHPYDKHLNRVKNAYGYFFTEIIPAIAFSPFIATVYSGRTDAWEGMMYAIIFAIPLMIPTVVTMLCAAIIAVLAGLTAPFAFAGGALADVCENLADDTENEASFAY